MALHQTMASSKIDSLYGAIDSLFDAGQISEGTYQFASDLIQYLDPDEQDYDVVAHAQELVAMSIEELKNFREEDIKSWQEESPEDCAIRFEFGEDQIYRDLESLISPTDFAFIRNKFLPMYFA